jgi:hypothetical protein
MAECHQEELPKHSLPLLVAEGQPAHALQMGEDLPRDHPLGVGFACGFDFPSEYSVLEFASRASFPISSGVVPSVSLELNSIKLHPPAIQGLIEKNHIRSV